jgi:hypothetical protein
VNTACGTATANASTHDGFFSTLLVPTTASASAFVISTHMSAGPARTAPDDCVDAVDAVELVDAVEAAAGAGELVVLVALLLPPPHPPTATRPAAVTRHSIVRACIPASESLASLIGATSVRPVTGRC